MKAALFSGGHNITVSDMSDPSPSDGEVLVKVFACGICGSDMHLYHHKGKLDRDPWIAGHEISGEVSAVGSGVQSLSVGDRVAIEPTIPSQESPFYKNGRYELADLSHIGSPAHQGGFAEYAVAPEDNVHKLPDSIDDEAGALVEVYATAVHAHSLFPVHPGDRVAVIGSGPIGLTIAEMAELSGAEKVIIIGKPDAPLEIAKNHIGAEIINVDNGEVAEKIKEKTGGMGADLVFEAVGGRINTLQQATEIAGRTSRICMVGGHVEPLPLDSRYARGKELVIGWSFCYGRRGFRKEFTIAIDLLAAGKLVAKPWITHSFPLSEIGKAFEATALREEYGSIKVLVNP